MNAPPTSRSFLPRLSILLGLVMTIVGMNGIAAADEPTPPNVIVLLVDDMGWTDLGCQGSTFYETPHIDHLAADGMRFTQGYAACTVCSPTRAAVLTGKYPARLHLTDWIAGHNRANALLRIPNWTKRLEHEETTLAEVFGDAGYATAHVGKWHLGPRGYWPTSQGFDMNIAGYHRGQPPSYFFPYRRGSSRFPEEVFSGGEPGEQLTDRLTDEALTFIEQNKDQPFFLYFPYYAVHTPLQGKQEYIDYFTEQIEQGKPHRNATYAAMIRSVDDSVGRLREKLDELEIADNTVIIFTSDNGGLQGRATSNVPLRAGKGSAYEGGVRVPLIVQWPGVTEPGSTCDTAAMSIDYFPTLIEIAEIDYDLPDDIDGVSLVPLLTQKGEIDRDAIFWHYPHYHPGGATPYSAIRSGDWRLVEFFEDNHVELYNLADDIGETTDLIERMPDRARAMHDRLVDWRNQVDAQLPTPNPNRQE